jgi:hypothetical protein
MNLMVGFNPSVLRAEAVMDGLKSVLLGCFPLEDEEGGIPI